MDSLELKVIVSSVERVRTRLYCVRLLERVTVGVLVAGAVSIPLMLAKWQYGREAQWAYQLALLPTWGALYVTRARWRALIKRAPEADAQGPIQYGVVLAAMAAILSIGFTVMLLAGGGGRVQMWMIPASIGALMAIAGIAWTRKISRQDAAIFVDQQAGLKEKVSTALEFEKTKPASEMEAAFRQPLISSAVAACQAARTARVGYRKLNQWVYPATAACVAAAVAATWLVPLEARARVVSKENQLVAENMKQLEKALDALKKEHPPKDPSNAPVTPLEQAVQTIKKDGEVSPMEAIRRLNDVRQDLDNQLNEHKAGDKAQMQMAENGAPEILKQVADKAHELSQAQVAGAKGQSGAASDKQRAEQGIKDAAKAAGDKLSKGEMSAQEKAEMGKQLEKAAAAAGGDQKLQEALKEAKAALDKGDGKSLEQNLADAGHEMGQQMSSNQLSSKEIQETISAIDGAEKGLSEQEQQAQNGGNGPENGGGDQDQGGPQQANGGQQGGSQQGDNGQQQANGQQPGDNGQQGGDQDQQGNQGQGQGQQANQGQGQGQQGNQPGQGQGNGQQTAGLQQPGSTELKQAGGPGDHSQNGDIGGSTDHKNIYGENQITSDGARERPKMQLSKGQSAGSVDVMDKGKRNEQIMAYEAQQAASERQAMQQIDQQQIPPQYQELIKGYYQNPDKAKP